MSSYRFVFVGMLFAVLAVLAAPPNASAYDLIVVGDTNLFPFDTANAGDIGNMVDCYNGSAVCPPGCNQNLFPFDTCNAGDIGGMVDYLNGLPLGYFPGSGYLNFTTDPGNPAGGSGTYGVIVDMVSAGSNLSGFDNVKGVLGVRAEILSDTGGGALITPPLAGLLASGNGMQVGAGVRAQGTASVDLTCGGGGNVTIRFFVPAYSHNIAAGEHCAGGAACAPGEHMDQIDIVVTCGVPDPCVGQPDGTICGRTPSACDGGETCQSDVCVDNGFVAAGSACGDTGVECLVSDTCDGAGACVDNGFDDGAPCAGNGAGECSGADTCLAGACLDNDFVAGSACGDTGVECLVDDTCDGAGACVDNGLEADGSACGDPSVTSCDLADTCLAGVCDANPVAAGSACGDTGVECLVDDTCDGLGSCIDNGLEADGTACGDPSVTECDLADTCSAGACVVNNVAPGSACGDQGVECLVDDTCDGAGACTDNGAEPVATPCGDPSDTECTNPDSCDGAGACLVNNEAAGFACGDQGVDCLVNDACDGGGTCVDAGLEADGTACGDPTVTECDLADTCTAGACVVNNVAAGAACGDTGVECLVDDTCDGAGACTDNGSVPNGSACTDDGLFCTGEESCWAGVCEGDGNPCEGGAECEAVCDEALDTCNLPVGTPCGDASDTECTNPDTCDGAGACLTNDETAGFACGDTGVECLVNDTCDGAGVCVDNGFDDGASCAGNGAGECSGADTCLAGACLDNDLAAGAACGDTGVECLVDDTCDGLGACVDNGFEAAGNACGDVSDTECTNPDTCDGVGACLANDEAAGFACGDQGLECLVDDFCDGSGLCTDNGAVAAGTACGDASDTECTNPDTCDGVGACLPNDEAAGFACGDQGVQCVIDDACDGAGLCTDNGFNDGAACDDADACTESETCSGGVCGSGSIVDCTDGVVCTVDDCDSVTGCSNLPNDGLCDDGFFCNGAETCDLLADCQNGVNEPIMTPCGPGDVCDGLGLCIEAAVDILVNVTDLALVPVPVDPAVGATAGEDLLVSCTPVDSGGFAAPTDEPVTYDVTGPDPGLVLNPGGFTPTVAGLYSVTCQSAAPSSIVSSVSYDIIVGPAAPDHVDTTLTPGTVEAGATSTVTCDVYDAYNNPITGIPTTFAVSGSPGGSQTANDITPHTAGSYTVTCSDDPDTGLTKNPAFLTVIPGPAAAIDYVVTNPLGAIYPWSYNINTTTTVWDAYGNTIPSATWTFTPDIVSGIGNVNMNGFQLNSDGLISVTADVTSATVGGLPVISPPQQFNVDGQPPLIVFTNLERAEQKQAPSCSGTDILTVNGLATDLTGVASLSINGSPVTVNGDDTFSFNMTPQWGMNVITGSALDTWGFENQFQQSFLWSPTWHPNNAFGDYATVSDLLADTLRLRFQQEAIDDNEIGSFDDLAEVAFVAFGNINLAGLLPYTLVDDWGCPFADIALRATNPRIITPADGKLNLTSMDLSIIDGGLHLYATASTLVLRVHVRARSGCVNLFGCGCTLNMDQDVDMTFNNIQLNADAFISEAGGAVTVNVTNVNVTSNFSVSGGGFIIDVINFFGLDGLIWDMVRPELEGALQGEIGPLLQDLLNSLSLGFDLDLTDVINPSSLHHAVIGTSGAFASTTCGDFGGPTAPCLELDMGSSVYLDMYCEGGANDGTLCANNNNSTDCPGGECVPAQRCVGGLGTGVTCIDDSVCGGGVCSPVPANTLAKPSPGSILQCTNNPPIFEVSSAQPFQIALDHDFLNQLFWSLWAAGVKIDIEPVIADALGGLGGIITVAELEMLAPPVVDWDNGLGYHMIQLGDLKITLVAEVPGVLPPGTPVTFYASGYVAATIDFQYLGNCDGGADVGLRCPSATPGGASDCPLATCANFTDQLVIDVNAAATTLFTEIQVPTAPVGAALNSLIDPFKADLINELPALLGDILPATLLPEIDLNALEPTIFPPGSILKINNVVVSPGEDFAVLKGALGN